jgi:hypothetical protein
MDTRSRDKKAMLEGSNRAKTLDVRYRDAHRIGVQQTVMQCLASLKLDAVTYPTGNIPPVAMKQPSEPTSPGQASGGDRFSCNAFQRANAVQSSFSL